MPLYENAIQTIKNNLQQLQNGESRVKKDGYKISDLIQQITNAISENSKVIITERMTVIQNQTPRNDGYGNIVNDRAIFELTTKKPRAELFSVIPKGG